jgi:hypothetical protein
MILVRFERRPALPLSIPSVQSHGVSSMKKLVKLISALVLISPVASFAQDTKPLTRAEVYAEMVQYENSGFNPARQNPRTWVDDARHARVAVAAEQAASDGHEVIDHTANAGCNSHM